MAEVQLKGDTLANTITFSGCFIRTFAVALDEGSKRIRINLTASITKEVRKKMEWGEPAENGMEAVAKEIQLDGELHGRTLTLTPNEKELKKNALEIEISEVRDFRFVKVQENESTRHELRLQVITGAVGAAGQLDAYTDIVGQGKGECRISYVQQEVLDLPEVQATPEQRESVGEIGV